MKINISHAIYVLLFMVQFSLNVKKAVNPYSDPLYFLKDQTSH